jgi:hypothetical protein
VQVVGAGALKSPPCELVWVGYRRKSMRGGEVPLPDADGCRWKSVSVELETAPVIALREPLCSDEFAGASDLSWSSASREPARRGMGSPFSVRGGLCGLQSLAPGARHASKDDPGLHSRQLSTTLDKSKKNSTRVHALNSGNMLHSKSWFIWSVGLSMGSAGLSQRRLQNSQSPAELNSTIEVSSIDGILIHYHHSIQTKGPITKQLGRNDS